MILVGTHFSFQSRALGHRQRPPSHCRGAFNVDTNANRNSGDNTGGAQPTTSTTEEVQTTSLTPTVGPATETLTGEQTKTSATALGFGPIVAVIAVFALFVIATQN